MENGNEYTGYLDLEGKKSGKGILKCKNGDKYFGDVEVSENWSEPVSLERGKIIGLDPLYCHAA